MVKLLRRKLNFVPKHYYRTLWMGTGMAIFSLLLGMVFGPLLDNMAFMGIDLPIGLAFGVSLSTYLDKLVYQECRQLAVQIDGL